MIPVSFPGSNEIKKPPTMTDEECMSVWAINGVDSSGFPYFVTAWKPSYEDIESIKKGEPIYVKIVCQRLPPMLLFTLDENKEIN